MNKYIDMVESYERIISNEKYAERDKIEILKNINKLDDVYKLSTSEVFRILYLTFTKIEVNVLNKLINPISENLDRITTLEDCTAIYKLYKRLIKEISDKQIEDYMLDTNDDYEKVLSQLNYLWYNRDIIKFFLKIFSDKNGQLDIKSYNYFLYYLNKKRKLDILRVVRDIIILKLQLKNNDKGKVKEIFKEKIEVVQENINNVLFYKSKLIKQSKKFDRVQKEMLDILKNVKNRINNNKLVEIDQVKNFIKQDDLSVYLIDYNNSLLHNEYEDIINRQEELDDKKIKNKEKILDKYKVNIDIDKIIVDDDILDKKLDLINKFIPNLMKYNNLMLIFLNYLSIDNINFLISLLIDKDINEDFLFNNIIIIKDNTDNFLNNIKLFKDNNMSINSIIKYDKSILFLSTDYLVEKINCLKQYGIKLSNECHNFEFLINDVNYIIDGFIEIGEHGLISNNISLINNNSSMIIKRCIFNKDINEPIQNSDNKLLGNLRKEDSYYLSNDELNETIITNFNDFVPNEIINLLSNYSGFIIPNIKIYELDNYLNDEYTYKFNNLIISKNKVLKNYFIIKNSEFSSLLSNEDIILYSILYNYPKIITFDDIKTLKEILNIKTKSLL